MDNIVNSTSIGDKAAMKSDSKIKYVKWFIILYFQNRVPSMPAQLFVPGLVNHPGRTLYLTTVVASMVSKG